MKISKLALFALLGGALMAFGCGSDSSTGGAGAGGDGGAGGTGGAGGGGLPSCEATACIFCPAEALGPTGSIFGDINVPVNFTAVAQGDVVQGGTVTIDIAATTEISGLPVPITATVGTDSSTTYTATSGGTGSLVIPIPEQTLMGTDLMIDAGSGSGPFVVASDANELVIQLTSALIVIDVTVPLPLSLSLDASEGGDCSVTGDGVSIPVQGTGGTGGAGGAGGAGGSTM
jgi:hypothetical protein